MRCTKQPDLPCGGGFEPPCSPKDGGKDAAATVLRYISITSCLLLLILTLISNTATALNQYQDIIVTLSARPLGMGGACAAVPQPASVFSNPGALGALRRFSLMWNHSARHFGWMKRWSLAWSREAHGFVVSREHGAALERDQLDGDTEAIVVPLPLATYAHGWTARGENGYDYTNHPVDGSLGYPREDVSGTEEYDALAANFGLPLALGLSQRRNVQRFTPSLDDPAGIPWLRWGEGYMWGVYWRVCPGLAYGHSEAKHNYDWTVVGPAPSPGNMTGDGAGPTNALPTLDSRIRTKRSGFALHPCGWLTLAQDTVRETYTFRAEHQAAEKQFFGRLHEGDQSRTRSHLGVELQLGTLGALRWGMYDGQPTWGLSLNLVDLTLNYAEVKDLLPEIVGVPEQGKRWKDVHIYGAELP